MDPECRVILLKDSGCETLTNACDRPTVQAIPLRCVIKARGELL
jgi:hypothetical protein